MERPRIAFLLLAVAIFLTVLDLFIVNVALPTIAADFPGASLASVSWVLTAYAIAFAAALVPAGKLGDLYGRRRVFLLGLALFVGSSALAAAATTLPLLVAARGIQAVGAAAITPNSLGLGLTLFAPEKRPNVIAAWGAIAGLGAATGPVAGAFLANTTWRWIFLINLPLGLLALILVPRMVREVRDSRASGVPDLVGATQLTIAVSLLVLALSQAHEWHWDWRVYATIATALVLTVAFLRRSSSHPVPIVDLPMFRLRTFSHAMAASVAFWAGFAAMLLGSALFLTSTWHLSVLQAGLLLAPGPAMASLLAASSGRLATKFGAVQVAMAGAVAFAAGGLWLASTLTGTVNYLGAFLPGHILIGVGTGMVLPNLVSMALAELPPTRLSTGTAVYTTFRQIGSALGVGILVAILGASSLRTASGFVPAWMLTVATGALTLLALAASPRIPLASRATSPAPADPVR